MKKALKIVLFSLLGLVLVVAALSLAHPFWLPPVAKSVARSKVPQITGTAFRIDGMELNAYSGRFSFKGIELENPQGFSERIFLKVENLDVVADMETVTSNVVVLEEVTIKGVFVSYVSNNGVNNVDQITKNASRLNEKDEKADAASDSQSGKKGAAKDETADAGVKVIIRRLNVSDASVKLAMFTLPVPAITLTDVGEKSGGVTLTELGNQLFGAIMSAVGSAKDGLGALGALLGDGAGSLKDQLKRGDTKAVRESVDKTADTIKDAAGALKSLFK
jgi:uncharacterized protein involved in outer membrane biogenesis